MPSLATCIQKAGELFSAEDRRALMLVAQELRRQGAKPRDAELQAVARHAEELSAQLVEREQFAAGGKITEAVPETPAADAPAQAQQADARLAEVSAQFPDLMVQMDGMDKPLPMAEFIAAARAEADELAADAPLMQVAAQCALLHGA